jgi:hypothetical protein
MRRKSIPPPPPPKQKPRPRTTDERVLTVAEYFAAKSRTQKDELLPMIRIRGQWLKKIGFGIGEFVIVKAEPKRLVLTVAEE